MLALIVKHLMVWPFAMAALSPLRYTIAIEHRQALSPLHHPRNHPHDISTNTSINIQTRHLPAPLNIPHGTAL
jgi:hypothetical protein